MSLHTTLIDVRSLAATPPDDVLIVDCRFDLADPAKGARDYLDGHIPGAVYASLDRDLSDLSRTALTSLTSALAVSARPPLPSIWRASASAGLASPE